MRILVDNALSPIISSGLCEKAYDAIHVRDIDMAAASDTEILDIADEQGRIIISADTDFGTLLALRQMSKPSFILFRQSDKRPKSQLRCLLLHLPKLQDDLKAGCIVVFEDQRIRLRNLPISKG